MMFGISVSTIVSILLTLLKVVGAGISYLRSKQLLNAGHDRALAEGTTELLVQTKAAKEIMQRVSGMSEAEVDATLKELEPK